MAPTVNGADACGTVTAAVAGPPLCGGLAARIGVGATIATGADVVRCCGCC
jgi:hypothetical protein